MIVKQADPLRDLAKRILIAAGAEKPNADEVAHHLVASNLCGVDTHGVWHLEVYVSDIKEGRIDPTARPEVLKETPNSALVSARWTFGQVGARFAMETAIEKARRHDMAVVSLVQSHHIGRLGHYAEMAAAEGMISIICGGGYNRQAPRTVPYGGRQPVLDTNPISMGFPSGDEPPMVLDFATTTLSGVKVVNAQRRGEKLPPGCIVDKEGRPSTDPNDFFDGGAFVAFGAHKGYGLMMATEFLGRLVGGADRLTEPGRGGPIFERQGVAMLVFRADLFQPMADYAEPAAEFQRQTRAVPPAPGFEQVLVPGQKEHATRIERSRQGIPIEDDVWQSVVKVAGSLGIDVES